jgi:hypothetical protein
VTQSTVTSRTIAVEHIKIESGKKFEEVRRGLAAAPSCGDFQVNGKQKAYYYDKPDQVPTYIVIDTNTGDERFYADLKDVPKTEQAIFQGLSNGS